MKQYDTKPIWERALAALAETNRVMASGFEALRAEIATANARMDAAFDQIRIDSILPGVVLKERSMFSITIFWI
ncbi:MAG TPA: hypothetical protein VIV66_11415 [Pyrinomonadaceae bacterium]